MAQSDDIVARFRADVAARDALYAADAAKEVTVDVIFWDRRGDMIKATVTGIAPFEACATVGAFTGVKGFTALGQPYASRYGARSTRYRNVTRNGEKLLKLPLLTQSEAADLAQALNDQVKVSAVNAETDCLISESANRLAEIRGVDARQPAEVV